jgi:FMN phosphatase YigB (HAD superfamily)
VPEQLDLAGVTAVIFDVDGTLYRQRPLRRAMAARMVRAHLLRPVRGARTVRVLGAYRSAQEELRSSPALVGLAGAQAVIAAERSGVPTDEVQRCVAHWMDTVPLDLLCRYVQPGLTELLESLRRNGIRLGVFSDYPATDKLRALGIGDLFDVVVCAGDAEVSAFKPSPRGLLIALERLGVGADEALYVGDRVDADAAAAAAAGVRCAILTCRRERVDLGDRAARVRSLRELHEEFLRA